MKIVYLIVGMTLAYFAGMLDSPPPPPSSLVCAVPDTILVIHAEVGS